MVVTSFLERLFASDMARLSTLGSQDNYGTTLGASERLLADADGLDIVGVEKLRCVGSIEKLRGLNSELRIGNMFARLGFTVEVLADEAFGCDAYTPDLSLRLDGLEVLVEVVGGSCGSPKLAGPLDRELKRHGLQFRVSYFLGESLSSPGVTYDEREAAEQAVDQVVDELVAELKRVDPAASGEIHVDGHSFKYEPSPLDDGYVAGGRTAMRWLRERELGNKLLRELERKAKRQARLPSRHVETPFVVAYDNRESDLTPEAALSALTGRRGFAGSSLGERARRGEGSPVFHPPLVESALDGPWGPLLEEWDFGRESDRRFTQYGALIDAEWTRPLSGVLVTHVIDVVQWLPNPFAVPSLCAPALMQIGLSLDRLGSAHPAWRCYP